MDRFVRDVVWGGLWFCVGVAAALSVMSVNAQPNLVVDIFGRNLTLTGDIVSDGLNTNTAQSVTVNAATTFAVTSSYVVLNCTGAETINTITGGVTGARILIEHGDTDCTIADDDNPTAANAIDLTGAATNDVGAVAKNITLYYDGSNWFQTGESDN